MPSPVLAEPYRRGDVDPAVRLALSDWLIRVTVPVIPPEIINLELGAGESAVIALGAAEPNTLLILDDRAARKYAIANGMTVPGTLWLVAEAKRKGIVRVEGGLG